MQRVIRGTVSPDGTPTIRLSVAGKDWVAIVDTGFNGDLELPDALRTPLEPRYVGQVTSALAGGQVVEEEVFLMDFPFNGRSVQVEATFVSGNHILVGTRLLRGHRLEVNFASKVVELERVR